MKYVKLFEHFLLELADMNSAYPFREVQKIKDDPNRPPQRIKYEFMTKGGTKYKVLCDLDDYSMHGGHDSVYEIAFSPEGGNYHHKTDEHDALRILITVASIIAHIVNTDAQAATVPIYAKGTEKITRDKSLEGSTEASKKETKNDRINKFLAHKILSATSADYAFKDLGENGFLLVPVR